MRIIKLVKNDKFNVADLVTQIFETPTPEKTISYEKAAQVVDIKRAFKKAKAEEKDFVLLEDADHTALVNYIKPFPFSVMYEELLEVLDAIVKAEKYKVPEPEAEPKDGKADVSE